MKAYAMRASSRKSLTFLKIFTGCALVAMMGHVCVAGGLEAENQLSKKTGHLPDIASLPHAANPSPVQACAQQ
jgi:hypothetical protein